MEEDIEILEKYLKCENNSLHQIEIQAIENILNRLEQLEKEIKVLEQRYKLKVQQMVEYRDKNYISNSVIIKEIEKLKRDEERIREKKKSSYDCDRSKSRMQAYLTKTKEFKERLKELLGGKND